MYKFKIIDNRNIFPIEVIYRDNEYSLDYEPWLNSDITLVVGAYIQIGIDSSDLKVRKADGLCPHPGWKIVNLDIPSGNKGQLVLNESPSDNLVAYRIQGTENWLPKFDYSKGWLCLGNEHTLEDDSVVEFAINTMAVVDKNNLLKALWWKPKFREGFNLKSALNIP